MCSTANTIHCLRAIQKIAGDSEETKYRMSHEILTTFAPPQHWENAWTNVWRTLWAFNSSRSVCFVLWVNHLFFRRCPTVPVHRRPVTDLKLNRFELKKRPKFRKCIWTQFFHSKHSKSSHSIWRSQNVLRARQILASGATEVGQRPWGLALSLSFVAPCNSAPLCEKTEFLMKTQPLFQSKWVKHSRSENASECSVESKPKISFEQFRKLSAV